MSFLNPIQSIGIDFGTTNTCVAIREGEHVRVLNIDPQASQQKLIRTLVYLPNRQESFFGKGAIDEYFDRGMEGRFFQSIKKLLPNPDFSGTSLFGIRLSVEALIARFLTELKKRIEAEIGSIQGIPIRMGRPARYSLDDEREALAVTRFLKALDLAGFENITLIDEPTAAARSSVSKHKAGALVLVCDLGGGTSDFTLFRSKKSDSIETLSVYGVPVAGDSLDSDFFRGRLNVHFGSEIKYQRLLSSNTLTLPLTIVKNLPKWHQHAFLKEKSTWNFILALRNEIVDEKHRRALENLISLVEENIGYKLHQEVERLKIEISKGSESDFYFRSYPVEIGFKVDPLSYDQMIEPSIERIAEAALETLRLFHTDPSEVQILQFTGGTSKVPAIRRKLQSLFPNAMVDEGEAFTAVASGLASF
jgi:hypothetical chaperone protein